MVGDWRATSGRLGQTPLPLTLTRYPNPNPNPSGRAGGRRRLKGRVIDCVSSEARFSSVECVRGLGSVPIPVPDTARNGDTGCALGPVWERPVEVEKV